MKERKGDSWESTGGESPLASFVKQIYPVSDQVVNYINVHSFPRQASRGEYLLSAGEVSQHLFFIKKGAVRGFVKEGVKEITTWITAENELVTSIRGLKRHQPALENIQAIEPCELVAVRYDALQFLYDHYIEMNIVGRRLLEQYYSDAEERAFISRIPNAAKRYQYFLETKSNLANRIPLKFIASYLGMTIETLSRIRSRQAAH